MMNPAKSHSLSRLCIHTITTRPWPLEQAIEKYLLSGIRGISVWRSALEGKDLQECDRLLKVSGLEVVSLVRGGFFTGTSQKDRSRALDENKRAIVEARSIQAGMLVLVCGATPSQSLEKSRGQIQSALEKLIPYAEEHRVRLALEPLHPMYADTRSAINTLRQANEFAEYFSSPWLGVALDVYHVWWDPDLEEQIRRCAGHDHLYAVHLCDWKSPTLDMLNDRGIMGEGIIGIQKIIDWVEKVKYKGFYEVEIFSDLYWMMDQDEFLEKIIEAYLRYEI
jgi:sugar phosphate isomerase/epimerase